MKNFKDDLAKFFLLFSARQGLCEADLEKLERILHQIAPKDMRSVEKICHTIVDQKILDRPEDEILEILGCKSSGHDVSG